MPTHCRFDAMLPLNIAPYLCCFGVVTHVHTTQTKLEHEQNTRSPPPTTSSPIPDIMDALYHYITTKTVASTINSILIESANDTYTHRPCGHIISIFSWKFYSDKREYKL